jgi:amino acid transporter
VLTVLHGKYLVSESSGARRNINSAARIAEESKDPSRVIPKAIANATTFTYVIGFLFNLVLVLCMGNPLDLIHSPSGQPVRRPQRCDVWHPDRKPLTAFVYSR